MPCIIPPGSILLLIRHSNNDKSKIRFCSTTLNNGRRRQEEQHYDQREEEIIIYWTRTKKVAYKWIKKIRKRQCNMAAIRIQTIYRGMRHRKTMDDMALLYFPNDIPKPGGYILGLQTCITIQRYWRGALARTHVLLILTRHAVSLVQGPARMLHAARKLQALSTAIHVICQQDNHHQHYSHHLNAGQHYQQRTTRRERLTVHAAFRIAKTQDEASRIIQQAWRRITLSERYRRRSSVCCNDVTQYYNNKYYAWLGRSQNQFHFLLTALILTTNRKIFKLLFDNMKTAQEHNLKSNHAYVFDDSSASTTTTASTSANNNEKIRMNHDHHDEDFSDILACLHA